MWLVIAIIYGFLVGITVHRLNGLSDSYPVMSSGWTNAYTPCCTPTLSLRRSPNMKKCLPLSSVTAIKLAPATPVNGEIHTTDCLSSIPEGSAMSDPIKIVPSMVGTFDIGSRTLRVSPDTETIIRFVDSRFDHLRYVDDEQGCIALVWLQQVALTVLADFGIPETKPRVSISEMEYENWLQYEADMDMAQFEAELELQEGEADGQDPD